MFIIKLGVNAMFHSNFLSTFHHAIAIYLISFNSSTRSILKEFSRYFKGLLLEYPNVLCRINMTRHMCFVNDTTQHNTKRHKKLELMKNLKKIIKKMELPGLELTTEEVFRSDARC